MKVNVRFFSIAKDVTKIHENMFDISEKSSINDLMETLLMKYPGLNPYKQSFLIAVNHAYQSPHYVLKDGDEVAIIPPVSGG